jgi:hypothetical protein
MAAKESNPNLELKSRPSFTGHIPHKDVPLCTAPESGRDKLTGAGSILCESSFDPQRENPSVGTTLPLHTRGTGAGPQLMVAGLPLCRREIPDKVLHTCASLTNQASRQRQTEGSD